MVTKKILFVVGDYDSFVKCEQLLKDIGVKIFRKSFDCCILSYVFHVEANKEQAYKMFDLTSKYDCFLMKGEES